MLLALILQHQPFLAMLECSCQKVRRRLQGTRGCPPEPSPSRCIPVRAPAAVLWLPIACVNQAFEQAWLDSLIVFRGNTVNMNWWRKVDGQTEVRQSSSAQIFTPNKLCTQTTQLTKSYTTMQTMRRCPSRQYKEKLPQTLHLMNNATLCRTKHQWHKIAYPQQVTNSHSELLLNTGTQSWNNRTCLFVQP